jgi:quinol monooxygenase YgiN
MIRHIVLFSAKDPADIETIAAALRQLVEIPHASRLEVARNSRRDGLSAEIDLVVYAEFPDYAALDRYKAHPLYADCIAAVRPKRELRIAVDFEAGEDCG